MEYYLAFQVLTPRPILLAHQHIKKPNTHDAQQYVESDSKLQTETSEPLHHATCQDVLRLNSILCP